MRKEEGEGGRRRERCTREMFFFFLEEDLPFFANKSNCFVRLIMRIKYGKDKTTKKNEQ